MLAYLAAAKNTIILIVLAILIVFGGWNYYRKNVYYDALHLVAANKTQAAREAEQKQSDLLAKQGKELEDKYEAIQNVLRKQIEDSNRPASERVVYKLRDRWLPQTCPSAEAGGSSSPTQVGGLSREDEQFFIQFAAEAQRNTVQLNSCIDAWDSVK